MDGLGSAFRHEAAFRQELALAVVLIPAAFFVPVDWMMRAMLIGSVMLVLIVELLNSAVEAAVDYISVEEHHLAKRAKDMGSAAVLLSLCTSGAVWALALWQCWPSLMGS
ncbi:MAG: diacylglycerol kinase [Opitutales bacterium]